MPLTFRFVEIDLTALWNFRDPPTGRARKTLPNFISRQKGNGEQHAVAVL